MKLTDKEMAVLFAFSVSDYGAYDSLLWLWEIQENSTLVGRSFSGTISSMTEKGLIGTDTKGDKSMLNIAIRDTYTIWLTDLGKQVFNEYVNKPNDEQVKV